MIRVNNFFFEDRYYLGRRVDCVYYSADPRALRFYVATLDKVIRQGMYMVGAAASHNPASLRYRLSVPNHRFEIEDAAAAALAARYRLHAGVLPSSGVMAILLAAQMGASRVFLAGIDFYGGEKKYAFEPPRRVARILEPNRSTEGYDQQLHTLDLDAALVRLLLERGLEIFVTASQTPEIETMLPLELAPQLAKQDSLDCVSEEKHHMILDWEGRSGMYTIGTLVALRRGRALARAVRRSLPPKAR